MLVPENFVNNKRIRTWEGLKRKKQSCGLFLAKSAQSGTERKALGRQAKQYAKQTANPCAPAKNKTIF